MKKNIIILAFIIFLPIFISAQENKFGITLNGIVKTDIMFDTRQNVIAREGHFLLYPTDKFLDINGEDVNEKENFNMLSIQSKLTGNLTAPNAFGAKVNGVLEGAFFGHSNGDINGFRLRHAFLKLDWGKHNLIVGQYWHPFFITEVFPGTISFNTGVPFQPFSRNPQIRYTYKPSYISFSFTASSQRDFSSNGPEGASSVYLRNSSLPMLNFNVQYSSENFVAGAGIDYKSLLPQIKSNLNYKNNNKINSTSFLVYGKYQKDDFSIKAESFWGENSYDLLMLGGYAISNINEVTEIQSYTNIKISSIWADFSFGSMLQFGLFAGYTKNNGSDEKISGAYFSRGNNINEVFRISPRVVFTEGKVKFATEFEYTSASYGEVNDFGKVYDAESVANLRVLFSTMLFF
jgi:hypothetical protein